MRFNQPLKYKEVCKEMNDEFLIAKGTYRKYQLKRWQMNYEIEKIGTYYFIKRELTEDEKYIKANEDSFTKIIENLIIWYLDNQDGYMVYLSYDDLFGILKLVNTSYHSARINKIDEVDKFDSSSLITRDETELDGKNMMYRYLSIFFESSEKIMKDSLNYVLKDMVNKNMLLLNTGFKLYDKVLITTEGKKKFIWKTRICTPEQNSEIMGIQNAILKKYGLTTNSQFYYETPETRNKIKDEMKLEVSKKFSCDSYSKVLVMNLAKEVISKNCDNLNLDFIISNKTMINKILNSKCKQMLLLPDNLKNDFVNKYNKI